MEKKSKEHKLSFSHLLLNLLPIDEVNFHHQF